MLILAILFEVLAVVDIVVLTVFVMMLGVEIGCEVLRLFYFLVLTHGALFGLEAVFFRGSFYHVTVLQAALVRSASGVGRSDLVLQPAWEVVQLE